MTTAVGIDLVAVESVGEALREHGERYLSRVYTPAEVAASHGSPRRLAERFAAKEAAIKALRPDRGTAVPWREIELLDGPQLVLSGGARELARAAGLSRLAVSVSAQGEYATAVVYAASAAGGFQ
ncbi:MAG: acpS [Solirubrobacterales bacterium]|nr:acpS [Solirubrobacterales bacterium]